MQEPDTGESIDLSNIENIAYIIKDAAKLATQLQDYISYATVLSIHMGNPAGYSEKDRAILLNTLLSVFENDDELILNVGWDLPDLLIEYFLPAFDSKHEILKEQPSLDPLNSLFSLLCKKGNPKEVTLKALGALASLNVSANYDKVWNKTTRDDDDDDDDVSYYRSDEINLSPAEYKSRMAVAEKYFHLKFSALFELICSTLFRVKTLYPSRFLAPTSSGLVAFLATNANALSFPGLILVVKKLYTFPQNYMSALAENGPANLAESESAALKRMLQSYITYLCQFLYSTISVNWAHRFYLEQRHEASAESNQGKLTQIHSLDTFSADVQELATNLEELARSFDLDTPSLFEKVINEYVKSYAQRAAADDPEADFVQREDPEDPEDLDTPSDFEPSKEGIFLLVTQQRFAERVAKPTAHPSFTSLIKATNQMVLDGETERNLGLVDSLCFWALWLLNTTQTAQEFNTQVPDEKLVTEYLQCLTMLATQAAANNTRLTQLFFSVIERILSLQTPQFRYDYLIDTIESCPFPIASEVSIKSLKDFLIPPSRSVYTKAIGSLSSSVAGINISKPATPKLFDPETAVLPNQYQAPATPLSESQNSKVETLIAETVAAAAAALEPQQGGPSGESVADLSQVDFGLLNIWANFLTASPLSHDSMSTLCRLFVRLVADLEAFAERADKNDGTACFAGGVEIGTFSGHVQILKMLVERIPGQ